MFDMKQYIAVSCEQEIIFCNDYQAVIEVRWDGSVVRDEHLRDIKCTVHVLEVMGLNTGWVEFGVHSPV